MKRSLVVAFLLFASCNQRDDGESSATIRLPLARATTQPAAATTFVAAPSAWTHSPSVRAAWFGPPNAPALLAISCQGWDKRAARLVIVRYAPADKGAEALFAIQGSKGILRLPVSAVKVGKHGYVWRGLLDAADPRAEVLLGNGLKATVPGGGQLNLLPMGAAGTVVSECVLRQAQGDLSTGSARAASQAQTLPNLASNPDTSPADR